MTDSEVKLDETVDTIAASLLKRVKSRDEEAWQRLVYIYGPLVYRWCRKSGLEPNTAADIGQEVFAVVARKIDQFRRDGPGSTFRGWLYRITQNKLNDHWHCLNKKPEIVSTGLVDELAASVDASSDSGVMNTESDVTLLFRRTVNFIRGQFSEEDWRAFWRVTVDQVPAAQVAEELGCTRNKVYVAKSRILGRIRRDFHSDLESG